MLHTEQEKKIIYCHLYHFHRERTFNFIKRAVDPEVDTEIMKDL